MAWAEAEEVSVALDLSLDVVLEADDRRMHADSAGLALAGE